MEASFNCSNNIKGMYVLQKTFLMLAQLFNLIKDLGWIVKFICMFNPANMIIAAIMTNNF